MKPARAAWLACAVVLAWLVATSAASAAPAEARETAQGEFEVQFWPGASAGQGVAVIGVTLPADTPLPARVRVPIPAGTTVDWAGELDTAQGDVQRESSVETGTAGSVVEFQLAESREGQVEVSGVPVTVEGGVTSAKLDYVHLAPPGVVGFSVLVPSGVSDVRIQPTPAGSPQVNDAGESLFTLPSAELAQGATKTITVSYRTGGSAPAQGTGGLSTSALVGILAGVLLVATVILLMVVRTERSRRGHTERE